MKLLLFPNVFFEALFIHFPSLKQLQPFLSQAWVRYWAGWYEAQQILKTYTDNDISKWTHRDVVVRLTSMSLKHIVIHCPSDAERRLFVMREGFTLVMVMAMALIVDPILYYNSYRLTQL